MNAEITFRARVQDLSKAARLIVANRGSAKDTDFVDFLVSECVATLRSVGTSTEIPVQGMAVGTARIPLSAFEKIAGVARSFGKSEAQVTIADGFLKIGSWRYNSEAITVGTIPDQRIDLPVNASAVDTLALAELLSPEQLVQQGLHRRVQEAREARYRLSLEARGLAASSINQRLAAVRRLAYEAADCGLLSPELAAGIRRVKGAKQLGRRSGNWLSLEQCSKILDGVAGGDLRATRDHAMISTLVGCGLRRSELVALEMEHVQTRQGHWAIVDLVGKGGHIRTVPMPQWVKDALDGWTSAAGIVKGRAFRAISRSGRVWGSSITENVVWHVVNKRCTNDFDTLIWPTLII